MEDLVREKLRSDLAHFQVLVLLANIDGANIDGILQRCLSRRHRQR
jgi:hypothetical protein